MLECIFSIYIYQHGLMYICFILWVIIQYCIILLLTMFHVLHLGDFQVGYALSFCFLNSSLLFSTTGCSILFSLASALESAMYFFFDAQIVSDLASGSPFRLTPISFVLPSWPDKMFQAHFVASLPYLWNQTILQKVLIPLENSIYKL